MDREPTEASRSRVDRHPVNRGFVPAAGSSQARRGLREAGRERVSWPVTLTTSAPIISARDGEALTFQVGFDRETREFVATSREGGHIHPIFVGPSLTLACSAANQALQALAPLETLIRSRPDDPYWRTRPQYLQEVHFGDALAALRELVAAESGSGSGVTAMGPMR